MLQTFHVTLGLICLCFESFDIQSHDMTHNMTLLRYLITSVYYVIVCCSLRDIETKLYVFKKRVYLKSELVSQLVSIVYSQIKYLPPVPLLTVQLIQCNLTWEIKYQRIILSLSSHVTSHMGKLEKYFYPSSFVAFIFNSKPLPATLSLINSGHEEQS